MRYLHTVTIVVSCFGLPVFAAAMDTLQEELTCQQIGFKRGTVAFADCVMDFISRGGVRIQTPAPSKRALWDKQGQQGSGTIDTPPATSSTSPARLGTRASNGMSVQTEPVVVRAPSTPNEQACVNYGFSIGSSDFGQCVMQIDQAKQEAQIAERQYQLQLQQYQQQVANYQAQQEAIKKERDRRKWEMLARLGAGMANSRSPSFLGAFNEGLAAANGVQIDQPVAPPPPPSQNYTLRLPNGNQVYCSYNAGYMSCR